MSVLSDSGDPVSRVACGINNSGERGLARRQFGFSGMLKYLPIADDLASTVRAILAGVDVLYGRDIAV